MADLLGLLDEVVPLHDLHHLPQEEQLRRVSHPCVIDPVALFDLQVVGVEISSGEHLLREGDDVRRSGQVPVGVGPHLPGGASSRLHLVHDEHDAALLGDVPQSLEEGRASVVVSSFSLDRLRDQGRHLVVLLLPLGYLLLDVLQALLVLLGIVVLVLIKRILIPREFGYRPIEGRDIYLKTGNCSQATNVYLVDSFAPCHGEHAKRATMESALESENGETRGSW